MRFLNYLVFLLAFIHKTNSQTIHLVMAADVTDPKFSMTTNRGIEKVSQIFETISANLDYKPFLKVLLKRDEFNAASVLKTLENLKTESNDIIVFYYSGLAYYPETSKSDYPFLDLNDSDKYKLSLDEIGKILLKKGTRLSLAIADCRNTQFKLEIPTKPKGLKRPTVIISNKNKEIVKNLISTTCGLVKIASQDRNGKSMIINRTTLKKSENTADWIPETDQKEYSVFALAFSDVFEHNLKKSNTSITFPDLIRGVQYRMNYELNPTDDTNREQDLKWEIIPCKPEESDMIWTNIPQTYAALELKLNQLLDIKNKNKRSEFIENMVKKFNAFNHYRVWRIGDLSKGTDVNKKEREFLNLAEYLSKLADYNQTIQSIKIEGIPNLSVSIDQFKSITMREYYND